MSSNRLFDYCEGGNFNIHIRRCSAISSAKERKSGFIYNLVKEPISLFLHFMEVLTVYTLTSHVLTLKAHIT